MNVEAFARFIMDTLSKEEIESVVATIYDSVDNTNLELLSFADLPIVSPTELIDGGFAQMTEEQQQEYIDRNILGK